MNDFVQNIQSELNDRFTAFTKLVNDKNEQGGVRNMPKTDTDFAQTAMQQFDDIRIMVGQFATMKNRWNEDVQRYYAVDIQDNEVIVVDAQDGYRYYGFTFSVNGDKPEIDFDNKSRKKISYENYEEGASAPEGAFDFGKHITDIEEAAFAKVNEAEAKVTEAETKVDEANTAAKTAETDYAKIKAEYDEIKPKYDEYVASEEQRKSDEINAQKDSKFSEYEDVLSENAEFSALKGKKDEMSVEDIERECAVLYVKTVRSKSNFSKQDSNNAVVGVINDNDEDDIDNGYVHTKYGNIHVSR